MEKSQYKLCIEVLRKLYNAGVLKHIILIGSWCMPFYKTYFAGIRYMPSIKTRDMDLLISRPLKTSKKIDIPELLKSIGFIVGFKGSQGYIKLEHPDLVIEFLVPEKGRGTDKPYQLPQLGLNAQALRFLNFLITNIIHVKIEDISVALPHPANFALHKLIIFQRRKNPEKVAKDRDAAIRILNALIDKGEIGVIRDVYNSIPQKWQIKVMQGLEKAEADKILAVMK